MNNGEYLLIPLKFWKDYIKNHLVCQTPILSAWPVFIYTIFIYGSEGPEQHANEQTGLLWVNKGPQGAPADPKSL